MKRKILILLAAVLTVGVCVVGYTQSSRSSKSTATSQESPRELQREARHKEREERRAQRLAEYEHFLDSIVLARNFQFNPQSMQQQPAGSTRILNNPNYLLTIWGSEVDVCLPFIKGVLSGAAQLYAAVGDAVRYRADPRGLARNLLLDALFGDHLSILIGNLFVVGQCDAHHIHSVVS